MQAIFSGRRLHKKYKLEKYFFFTERAFLFMPFEEITLG